MREVDFIIQGAGIAGAALTRALKKSNISVLTIDHRLSMEPEGAGILLQENALLALSHLDMNIEDLSPLQEVTSINLGTIEHPKALRSPTRQYTFGLARHQLLRSLHAGIDSDFLALGRTIDSWGRNTEGHLDVELNDGTQWRCRGILAADGMHSKLREQVQGHETVFRSTHQYCWRLLLDNISHDSESYEIQNGLFRLGLIPTGERQLYVYLTQSGIEPEKAANQTWQEIKKTIDEFGPLGKPIAQRINSSTKLLRHPLADAPVYMPVDSEVIFIGDAAHPMTPNLGQGAAMALEDAVTLGSILRDNEPESASRFFRKLRLRRVSRLRSLSYMAGAFAHIKSPTLRRLRTLGLRCTPSAAVQYQQKLFTHSFRRQLNQVLG